MSHSFALSTSQETLAAWGTEHLEAVVAMDSSSDEKSPTIPSSEGQRRLSSYLRDFFAALGFVGEIDEHANLLVRIPPTPRCERVPCVGLMVHMDTAHGTRAIPRLIVEESWDGGRISYSANPRLHVDAESYPLLQAFIGDDVLHGPGDFPFGLDDKLGMAQLMTLARVLAAEPAIDHGEIFLVFRPDEEIGRMEAVEGLARELRRRGVRFGYTIDGLSPFEVNTENFDAARARVRIVGAPLALSSSSAQTRRLRILVTGVNTHGATAKSEGYLNATVVFARAMRSCRAAVAADGGEVLPVRFRSDPEQECNAVIELVLRHATADGLAHMEKLVGQAFEDQILPARRRGADVVVLPGDDPAEAAGTVPTDATVRLLGLLSAFFEREGPQPLLSEDSDGRQGYSNPHRVVEEDETVIVDFRLRDFSADALADRAAHVRAAAADGGLRAEVESQYVNMGPVLGRFADLPRLAEDAARAAGFTPDRRPIRGGTGVDPFLAQEIPVANLGTGYFAPESEKELTSRQNIARHVLWLVRLVERIAHAS